VIGPSPLLQLEGFNLVDSCPVEYMHGVCLGTIRKMVKLTFKGLGTKPGADKRVPQIFKDVSPDAVSEMLVNTRGVCENSRRTRAIDGHLKGEEYRNLLIEFWPVMPMCLDPGPIADIWVLKAFIVKAVTLPEYLYVKIDQDSLQELVVKWYTNFGKVFGVPNCSYNVHLFLHILRVRQLGPLTSSSAFAFEDHYGPLIRGLRAGTMSTGLQALQNAFLRYQAGHSCQLQLKVRFLQVKT